MNQYALAIFQAGVKAADPYLAVQQHLMLNTKANIHLIAFGKAACAMSRAAVELIPAEQLAGQGIVVTNYENVSPVPQCVVIGAGHPLPNADGFHAAQKMADKVKHATQDELVLVLISGGGSALLPYPVEGISLEDKIATTQLLLNSGATINQINGVRKHLSQLKGGGLARLAYPAQVHALILSDVLGDDLSAIASGCTVPDNTSYQDAIEVLTPVWSSVPHSVQQHLLNGVEKRIAETPKDNDPIFKNTSVQLCASNAVSVHAMQHAAENLGYQTQIYSKHLCGIAKDQAEKLANHIVATLQRGNATGDALASRIALLAGGETTVNVTGSGKGGRNQEFALAFTLAAEKHGLKNWTLLSGGTDGRDGPTDAAGGLVNEHTLQRIRTQGLDPEALLKNNDAYTALNAANDLLITGATGTNVADLQILLLHPLGETNV